jgi:hypothetical protein
MVARLTPEFDTEETEGTEKISHRATETQRTLFVSVSLWLFLGDFMLVLGSRVES